MRSRLLLLSEGRTLFYVTLMITLLQSHSSELVELGARAGAEQGGDLIREFGKSFIYHFMSKLSPHRGALPSSQSDDDINKVGHEQSVSRTALCRFISQS